MDQPKDVAEDAATLRQTIDDLTRRLAETEETLHAIREGEVDAVVVYGGFGPRVYTLTDADRPYRTIVERMQEGAVSLAEDGTILYANQRLAALLRLSLRRLIGQNFRTFVAEDDVPVLERLFAEGATGGGKGEVTLRAADGTERSVHLSVVDLPQDGGRILSGIVTDLTLQKQRTRELTEANAKLTAALADRERAESLLREVQKMDAIGQLTTGIAHDFNNLLTVITGNLDVALSFATDDRVRRMIEASQRAVERGARLTTQLLAFSRRQTLAPRPICPNALLRDMEPLLRRALPDSITVSLALDPRTGRCLVDPTQLESAILNLAVNAKDAMPDGGVFTIATGEAEITAADDATPLAGPFVVIAVSDTGRGMSAEIRGHAFEPFFTTKEFGKGTGLGLSQVYGFVRQSGGLVRLESEPGLGTTVRMYLPRTDAEAMPEQSFTAAAASRERRSGRILVVEDDADVRRIVVKLLGAAGYETVEAASGPAALDLIERGATVDLVFTDVLMPDGMTGFELAQEIERRAPGVAVLLTSGASAVAEPRNVLARPFHILRKPYRGNEMLDAVEASLKRRAQIRSDARVAPP
ncbi:MAG TPA: ATP-binding protein [Stellaceae bacterium]|nr:ATP-binding protein [Stellaceae bacterium]